MTFSKLLSSRISPQILEIEACLLLWSQLFTHCYHILDPQPFRRWWQLFREILTNSVSYFTLLYQRQVEQDQMHTLPRTPITNSSYIVSSSSHTVDSLCGFLFTALASTFGIPTSAATPLLCG